MRLRALLIPAGSRPCNRICRSWLLQFRIWGLESSPLPGTCMKTWRMCFPDAIWCSTVRIGQKVRNIPAVYWVRQISVFYVWQTVTEINWHGLKGKDLSNGMWMMHFLQTAIILVDSPENWISEDTRSATVGCFFYAYSSGMVNLLLWCFVFLQMFSPKTLHSGLEMSV